MKIREKRSGAVAEVNDSFGMRMIEQGRAVLVAPDENSSGATAIAPLQEKRRDRKPAKVNRDEPS